MSMFPNSFDLSQLLECAKGKLFGPGNPQLPSPPMLMFDEISHISHEGGLFNLGYIEARLKIHPDLWFFSCHFEHDPVMPGCLGLDAVWQLLGFFLGWIGGTGKGRAIAVEDVKFSGQILPENKEVFYRIDLKRVLKHKLFLGVADAFVQVDGKTIYEMKNLKVGLFKQQA